MSPNKTGGANPSLDAETVKQLSDQVQRRIAELTRAHRFTRLVPILTATLAMVGTLAAGLSGYIEKRSARETENRTRMEVERAFDELRQRSLQREADQQKIADLQKSNTDLQSQLGKLLARGQAGAASVGLSASDRAMIGNVRRDEDKLQERLDRLETVLENTPEKALSAVMIKQQIDALQDRTRGDMESIHGEIGRLFTLTQWFIGLIFTIALGVFGLALTNLRKMKNPD